MPNHRLFVRNIRNELYGKPSDIVRSAKLFKAGTLSKIDVTPKEFFSIKVCKSLKIESDQIIDEIEYPNPEIVQNVKANGVAKEDPDEDETLPKIPPDKGTKPKSRASRRANA